MQERLANITENFGHVTKLGNQVLVKLATEFLGAKRTAQLWPSVVILIPVLPNIEAAANFSSSLTIRKNDSRTQDPWYLESPTTH